MKYYGETDQQAMEPSAINSTPSSELIQISHQQHKWNLHHHSWKQQCQRRQNNEVNNIKKNRSIAIINRPDHHETMKSNK